MTTAANGHRSYGHRVVQIGPGHYRLFWTVDFKYPSSRLRHPRGFQRDTDAAGARRFARRWGLGDVEAQGNAT